MKKIYFYILLITVFLTAIYLINILLNKKIINEAVYLRGKQLSGIEIYYDKDLDIFSFLMIISNQGKNLHACSVIIDEKDEVEIGKIGVKYGFLNGFEKLRGNNDIKVGEKVDIHKHSEDTNFELKNRNVWKSWLPSKIGLKCQEGFDEWIVVK